MFKIVAWYEEIFYRLMVIRSVNISNEFIE